MTLAGIFSDRFVLFPTYYSLSTGVCSSYSAYVTGFFYLVRFPFPFSALRSAIGLQLEVGLACFLIG